MRTVIEASASARWRNLENSIEYAWCEFRFSLLFLLVVISSVWGRAWPSQAWAELTDDANQPVIEEKGAHLGDWSVGERYGKSMINDLNHWAVGWIDFDTLLEAKVLIERWRRAYNRASYCTLFYSSINCSVC